MASDVFISYSRKNSDFARRLIDRLTLKGKDAWVDWEGIPLTSPNWWAEIKLGIEQADSFLFIVSPDSMASVVCNMELDYAYALNKRVVPVIYKDVESRDSFASIADFQPDEAMNERLQGKDPLRIARDNWQKLSHINWIFFRADDDFDEAFDRLITTVETDLPYVKAHTRYLSRAVEWEREDRRADLLLFGEEIDRAEAWLQKGDTYAAQTRTDTERVDVVNPLPQNLHREYIAISRAEDKRRKRLARSAQVSIAVLAVVLVIGLAALVLTTQQVNDANQQVDVADTQAADANITAVAANTQVANAVNRESDALTAVARAEGTATQIPPTLTRAAVVSDITDLYADAGLDALSELEGEALREMDKLVARYPEEAAAWLRRGTIFLVLEDYSAALENFNRALELDSNIPRAYNNRGLVYFNDTHNYEAAIADFDAAIALDPTSASTYGNRGNAFARLEQYESAIADFNRAIELDPLDASAYVSRGSAHFDLEDYDGAIVDFGQAISIDPALVQAYNFRGLTYAHLGQFVNALTDLNMAITLDRGNAEAYVGRGLLYATLRNFDMGIMDLDVAIALDPDNVVAYRTRALIYEMRGDVDAAIADYTRSIEIDPTDISAHKSRGDLYTEQGNYRAAISDYGRTIEIDPNYALGYQMRATTYNSIGNVQAAITDFTRAIELDPDNATNHGGRGLAYSQIGEIENALADLDRSLELEPDNAYFLSTRGLVRIDASDFAGSIADFDAAIALEPDIGEHYYNRALAYSIRSDTETNPEPSIDLAVTDFLQAQRLGYPLSPVVEEIIRQHEAGLFAPAQPTTVPATTQPAQIGDNRGKVPLNGAQVWTYDGTAGETLTIRVDADRPAEDGEDTLRDLEGLDTLALVIGPDGETIAENDDIEPAVITNSLIEGLELPTEGTYQIIVGSFEGRNSGEYTLTIERSTD